MSKYSYKWPMQAWAVCYRVTDAPGGWVPYSGEIYWYKDRAVDAAKYYANSAVRRFYVSPKSNP